jgi:hypothetical protein
VASALTLWLLAIALECVPLARALQTGFLKRYKFFYAYLSFVLVRDLCLLGIYFKWPTLYAWSYWGSELFTVLIGCGLVWEVYKLALARYSGAARVARNVLPALFVLTITRVLVKAWSSPNWIPGGTPLETEGDLRTVQAALLLGLVALLAYYEIPLGRNLKGIVYGYGILLATSLSNLALREHLGKSFQDVWQHLQPVCYLVVVLIWCWALWSYTPVPESPGGPHLELDYQDLRRKIRSARIRLLRDIHP